MAEAAMITCNEIGNPMETAQTVHCEAPAIAERSEYVTALEARPDGGTEMASSSDRKCAAADEEEYMTARRRELGELRNKCITEEEFEIEKSREHWTQVGAPCSEDDLLVVDNRRHFQSLLRKCRMSRSSRRFHARWERFLPKHEFFRDYGGSLVVGQKIAEGGQAEVFEATLDGKESCVVKVYKSSHPLAVLQRQWTFTPHGETLSGKNSSWKLFRNKCCFIKAGTLLEDGKFAFVMKRYWGDLRKLIDLQMEKTSGHPPFQYPLPIVLELALGMKDLHKSDILHRDLKASNVLLGSSDNAVSDAEMKLEVPCDEEMKKGVLDKKASGRKKLYRFHCYIADFESSNACQGTGFWRAPEVLRAIQDRDSNQEIWTKKVDVYSYAMTCYEVLTGCLPLGNLARTDYDAVIVRGERPPLPDYIDDQIKDLLRRCWHSEPSMRPTFVQIVRELEALRRSKPTFFFTNYRGVG